MTDQQAWTLAIEMLRQSGEAVWVNDVDRMLEQEGFEATGKYAAHCIQFRTLKSRPWLMLPCDLVTNDIDAIVAAGPDPKDIHGWYAAAVLVRRMREAGISIFCPDPERALAAAKRARQNGGKGFSEGDVSRQDTPPL